MAQRDCQIEDCWVTATRLLIIAMECERHAPKLRVKVCERHGNALDAEAGRYLVMESVDLP